MISENENQKSKVKVKSRAKSRKSGKAIESNQERLQVKLNY